MNWVEIIRFLAHHVLLLSLVAVLISAAVTIFSNWKHGLPILVTTLLLIWGGTMMQQTHFYYRAAARQCAQNLQAIAKTKQSWAAGQRKNPGDAPVAAELFGPGKYLRREPVCPLYGRYQLGTVAEQPVCDHEPWFEDSSAR
jgi:hypothetical protein